MSRGLTSLSRAMALGFVRDKTALFFTILFPLMFLVLFGAIFGADRRRRAAGLHPRRPARAGG
jgi:hypothetical protein